ncbi:MAG: DUF4350 domain-containing protein [Chloroflexota bacterium]|nr:DUF4350 domain-containing protein [Chloroflexota bacterium]
MLDTVRQPNTHSARMSDLVIIAVTFLALFAVLLWLFGSQGVDEPPESVGSSHSTGPRGTLALYRWLERSGFEVSRTERGDTFPPDADTLIMVNPNNDFPTGQAGTVRRWVEEGNTLVLALGGNLYDASIGLGDKHPMLREFEIDVTPSYFFTDTVPMSQPAFGRPPVVQVGMPGSVVLALPLTGTVPLVTTTDAGGDRLPLAALMRVGEGRVFLLSTQFPLTNEGIREPGNGAFAYNMVQMAGGTRVSFDEAHHGATTGGDLVALLTSTPWGWALIYGAALGAIYFIWSARRLGPPLPVLTPDQRRPTSEYVTSVARLFRRARKPGYAAERYLRFLRRTLSRHAELDPYLTDSNFVSALGERGRHQFNQEEMLRAIQHLRDLEGNASGNEATEMAALRALREAERVRLEALGGRGEGS